MAQHWFPVEHGKLDRSISMWRHSAVYRVSDPYWYCICIHSLVFFSKLRHFLVAFHRSDDGGSKKTLKKKDKKRSGHVREPLFRSAPIFIKNLRILNKE